MQRIIRYGAAGGLAAEDTRGGHTAAMNTKTIALTTALTLVCSIALSDSTGTQVRGPVYTDDGHLTLPEDYREWVYCLSTGFDMAYSPDGHESPVCSTMSLSSRARTRLSLPPAPGPIRPCWCSKYAGRKTRSSRSTRAGTIKTPMSVGREIFMRQGHGAFSGRLGVLRIRRHQARENDTANGRMLCHLCHRDHAAVDNTFVQFYPTLLPIATAKGTLSAAYKAEEAARNLTPRSLASSACKAPPSLKFEQETSSADPSSAYAILVRQMVFFALKGKPRWSNNKLGFCALFRERKGCKSRMPRASSFPHAMPEPSVHRGAFPALRPVT